MPIFEERPNLDSDAELSRVGKLLTSTFLPDARSASGEGSSATSASRLNSNRNNHVFTLGAPFYGAGFRRGDADGLMGLLSLPASEAIALLAQCHRDGSFSTVLHTLLGKQASRLSDLGKMESWRNRWAAYQADLASWRQIDRQTRRQGGWRVKEMSEGQRHLVRVTATLLGTLIPLEMTRGEAADWLEINGANLAYQGAE